MKDPKQALGEDIITWFPLPSDDFATKLAYGVVYYVDDHPQGCFKTIWKVHAPQHLYSFLWLVANDAIITSHNRFH